MKKYFNYLLLFSFFITSIFTYNFFTPVASAVTGPTTISQLVELLITIGVIAPDKVVAARAAAVTLSKASTITSTSSLPYIQVLYPNGGESFDIDLDLPYSIKWGTSSQIPVNIALVTTRGAVCNLNPLPITSKNTENSFSVLLKTAKCYNLVTGTSSPVVDGTYKVRVSYAGNSATKIQDDSNNTFKILPVVLPTIKVTYPNGGENLVRNNEYNIKYSLKNVVRSDLVYLYLLDSNGNIAYNSHKLINSDRTYSLDLPSSLTPGAYKIKLKATVNADHIEIEDISDNYFWISSPY